MKNGLRPGIAMMKEERARLRRLALRPLRPLALAVIWGAVMVLVVIHIFGR